MDSELSSQAMVEVIAEFRDTQRERLNAAQKMIVPHVIRAVLDGADPKELAELCGFEDIAQETDNPTIEEMLFGSSSFLYGRSARPDALTSFANWLGHELTLMIQEAK